MTDDLPGHIVDTNINNESENYVHPQCHKQPPKHLQDYECYLSQVELPVEPRNYHIALKDPRWVMAMKEQLQALHSNQI